ncbi:MAG: hypothetical protein ABIR62_02680 [Dokdonella sp.]|uniref:hypothetical protein n=1 Tax=Dokdonella sp. TaxID=2291710 RepID=UPI0032648C56
MRSAGFVRVTLFGACCIAALLSACGAKDRSGRFSIALGQVVRAGTATVVDLASIGAPAWDDLFVFGSTTSREDACAALALGWLECRTTMPGSLAEDEEFLVFRVRGRISRAERHSRLNGDFLGGPAPPPQPILRAASKFRVMPVASSPDGAKRGFRLAHEG